MPEYESLIQPPGVGRVLAGRYRLVAPVARGGMAEVWEAHDEVLTRPVAAKVLQAHLAADGVFLERFRREAVTAARLAHPGIVATFDTGYDQGTAFIVMELVRGRNLRQWIDNYGRMEPWQAVAVARQVADALAYAHQAGLVHRDVKPANILLVDDEWGGLRVKVTDFGIAKAGQEMGGDLTRTGIVLGTPKYLSPEQLRGGDPDPRADLYSLGVVLYEMLVGAPPYQGDTDMAVALAHLGERIPKPSASIRGIPGGLDRIVVELLAKTPDRRIQSAMELRRRLDSLGPLAPPSAGGVAGARQRSRRRADPEDRTPAGWTPPPAPVPAPSAPTVASSSGPLGSSGGETRVFSPAAPPPPPRPPGSLGPPGPSGTNGSRPVTDQFASYEGPPPGPHRNGRIAGLVVAALFVVGVVVAVSVVLTSGSSGHHTSGGGAPGGGSPAAAVPISGVTVYMDNARPPDDPEGTKYTFDGDPSTKWSTDVYHSPTFGNLYDGIGLEISLSSAAHLSTLSVTSTTVGWSASTYVSTVPITSGQSVAAWGTPTDSLKNIDGDARFSLGGRKAAYVLLWITNLGPADQASVAELSVAG